MKKLVTFILLASLALTLLAGCGAPETPTPPDSEGGNTPTQPTTPDKTPDKTPDTTPDKKPEPEDEPNAPAPVTVEELLCDSILGSISPDAATGEVHTDAQMEDAFINSLVDSVKEPTPADDFRSVYGGEVNVAVDSAENGTATVTVKTPDLYTIIIEAAESLTGTAFTKDELFAAVTNRLTSGDYPTAERTVTAAYTEVNGLPVIEETGEYINALYGGLLDLYREQMDILTKEGE